MAGCDWYRFQAAILAVVMLLGAGVFPQPALRQAAGGCSQGRSEYHFNSEDDYLGHEILEWIAEGFGATRHAPAPYADGNISRLE